MKSIILHISTVVVVYCMPQNFNSLGNTKPSIEIEKQVIVELTPAKIAEQEAVDKTTREILAKIEQVNQKQGYVAKRSGTKKFSENPHYYTYSYQERKPDEKYSYNVPENNTPDIPQQSIRHDSNHFHPKKKISRQQLYLIPAVNFSPNLIVAPIDDVLGRTNINSLPHYTSPYYWYYAQNFPINQNPPAMMLNSITTVEYDTSNCNSRKWFGKNVNPETDDRVDDETGADVEVHLDNFFVANNKSEFITTKNRNEKGVQEQSKQRPHKPILIFHHSQPNLTPELADEIDTEGESETDKSVETNDKKLFSKDNIGDGIFIRRLKVRKGGVAIAGPGGIATAGSGGTAIVGPNGWAYTHPDSLAIAGAGTKVIAVDPNIKLGDLIKRNVTRKGALNTRVGKVVAVGPVIYYNRG